jgi:hypothetical protein
MYAYAENPTLASNSQGISCTERVIKNNFKVVFLTVHTKTRLTILYMLQEYHKLGNICVPQSTNYMHFILLEGTKESVTVELGFDMPGVSLREVFVTVYQQEKYCE